MVRIPAELDLGDSDLLYLMVKIIEMKTKTLTILLNALLNHVSRVGSINKILLNLKMHTSLL